MNTIALTIFWFFTLFFGLFTAGLGLIYMLPAIIAVFRSHCNCAPIVILNILLGWTVIGWVIPLAWSCSKQGE